MAEDRRVVRRSWRAVALVMVAVALLVAERAAQEGARAQSADDRTNAGGTARVGERPIPVQAEGLTRGRAAIAAAVEWSRVHHDIALVVDKSAFSLMAYLDGRELHAWPVELGWDPIGRKERQGDRRTPEGRYRVTWRREPGETRFHRALLLDYPNAADQRQGRTGSLIEIHGSGSGMRPGEGGLNWTLGCVAMSNGDIDALFALGGGEPLVREGTPVTIVYAGSLPDERYLILDPAE